MKSHHLQIQEAESKEDTGLNFWPSHNTVIFIYFGKGQRGAQAIDPIYM